MRYSFKPRGVCAYEISFDIDNNIVSNVEFSGGCNGNGKGVAGLAEGMPADEVIKRLEGITCGFKPTSCPDQLAKGIKKALEENQ